MMPDNFHLDSAIFGTVVGYLSAIAIMLLAKYGSRKQHTGDDDNRDDDNRKDDFPPGSNPPFSGAV